MCRPFRMRSTVLLWVAAALATGAAGHGLRSVFADDARVQSLPGREADVPPSLSPEQALAAFRLRPGFRIELMAAEPLLGDPIAFDWSADGRLWVLEMGDYPLGTDASGKPGGVVKSLDDADGDGRFDRSTIFLDGLPFPTGLMPWRNGLLIACAPDILYAEDADGDGRADRREVLFTGFRPGNQQHRLNGFELGLDGWVYGANGDSGGRVQSPRTGKVVDIPRHDFRFDPDSGAFEAEVGTTQYGRHRDDYGTWFGNNNPTWAWQFVLEASDLARNPRFGPLDVRKTLEPVTNLFPASRTLPRFNDLHTANHVTSANSPTPYRDVLFGAGFEHALFVSEPVHNLVHAMRLEPDGATWTGRRLPGEEASEFLASTDHWFRPTMLRTGPDGALWIADMYRAVIEHPEWIPDDWEARLDLRAGHDQGRIYRVYPEGQLPRPVARLDRLDTKGLVAALASPSGWVRDTAQRLLLHRRDPEAAPLLAEAVRAGHPAAAAGSGLPLKGRLQALWTLRSLGLIEADTATSLLASDDPLVAASAIRCIGGSLDRSTALGEAVLARADDPDPRVRLAVALALGTWADPRAGRALAAILGRDREDPWLRAAVLSSAAPHAGQLLGHLAAAGTLAHLPDPYVRSLFATAGVQASGSRTVASLLPSILEPATGGRYASWQFAALAALLDQPDDAGGKKAIVLAEPGLRERFDRLCDAAGQVAVAPGAAESDRLSALGLLGRRPTHVAEDRARLASLLDPKTPGSIQLGAVAALARSRDDQVARVLVAPWRTATPGLRTAILDTLLSRPSWTAELLSCLEDGCVPPSEIGAAYRRRLLALDATDLKRRAEAVLSAPSASRKEVLDRYRPTLATAGDPQAGAAVYRKLCASCHRFDGQGVEVGPGLATITDRSPEALLAAILDPNQAFEAKYASYTVATRDGRVLEGLISAESGSGLSLRKQEGKEDALLRDEIEEIAASGRSLMPEGLENDLSPRDLADLIAYLRTK